MRSKFFVCTVLASVGLTVGIARTTLAADPKAKAKKSATDEAIDKQLSWEDKVMGPDDKRSELDKILKAQAINKAATEKAAREKEKADKEQAAREAKEAAAPKPQQKKGGEVALPSLGDEEPSSSKGKGKGTEISPKLDTAAAAAPPPPAKPADDKFIDKLLKEEGSGKKKKVAAGSDDKDLLDILSTDKKAGSPKSKGKASEVDALLQEVDKPAAPVKKIQHETPEWQKPEIQSAPTVAAPLPPARPAPRANDGVIRVVQGAGGSGAARSAPAAAMTPPARRPAPPPVAPAPSRGGAWDDPFADSSPRKKAAAHSTRAMDEEESVSARRNASVAPAPSKTVRGSARTAQADDDMWEDPFDRKAAAAAARRASTPAKPNREAAPARGGRWKDPFTAEDSAPAKPARGTVAMRDSGRAADKDESGGKWEAAARRGSDSSSESSGSQAGRWGVLKKR